MLQNQTSIVLLCNALFLGCFVIVGAQLRMTPQGGRHLEGTNVLSLEETRTFLADRSRISSFDPAPHFYMSTADLALASQNSIPSGATEEDLIALLQMASQEAERGKRGGGDRRRNLFFRPIRIHGGGGGNDDSRRQTVFLDFHVDEFFQVGLFFESTSDLVVLTFESYQLSQNEKETILQRLKADYAGFLVDFVVEEPMDGEFSTLSFNTPSDLEFFDGVPGVATGFVVLADGSISTSILFGKADGIDLLNKNMTDGAWAQVNFWKAIEQVFDDGGLALEFYSGITINYATTVDEALSIATVNQVANTAAHELGHILGLRHHDSIGAIGDDIPDFVSEIVRGGIVDLFVADQSGSETFLHVMASSPSVGLPLQESATTDRFFSERSAIKLLLGTNGGGLTYGEDEAKRRGRDIGSNEPGMRLRQLAFPNEIVQGIFAGNNLAISTLVIEGNIDAVGGEGTDYFRFSFEEGQFVTASAISVNDSNVADIVVTGLTFFQEDRLSGELTPLVTHFQDFESFDPLIFDFEIPETGYYVISVFAQEFVCTNNTGLDCVELGPVGGGMFNTGDYTLLVYSVDLL